MSPPTHYTILSLTPSYITQDPNPTRLVKRAYRRALLSHHPDKTKPSPSPSTSQRNPLFSIDQISAAYATLSNPTSRAEYDKHLLTLPPNTVSSTSGAQDGQFQTGIEIVDLDDLSYEESRDPRQGGQWYRGCRCGNERGYVFGEDDLEDVADLGELMVGCADCSLWLRIQFAVVVEEEGEREERAGRERERDAR